MLSKYLSWLMVYRFMCFKFDLIMRCCMNFKTIYCWLLLDSVYCLITWTFQGYPYGQCFQFNNMKYFLMDFMIGCVCVSVCESMCLHFYYFQWSFKMDNEHWWILWTMFYVFILTFNLCWSISMTFTFISKWTLFFIMNFLMHFHLLPVHFHCKYKSLPFFKGGEV